MFEDSKIDFTSFLYLPINIPFGKLRFMAHAGSVALNKDEM